MLDIKADVTFHVPMSNGPVDSFLPQTRLPKCKQLLLSDTTRSGITPEQLGARPITAFEGKFYEAAYRIAYPHHLTGAPLLKPSGDPVYYRDRFLLTPEGIRESKRKNTGVGKYVGPKAIEADGYSGMIFVHKAVHPVIRSDDHDGILYIHEGEKKAVSFLHQTGKACIAIGGCNMWNTPTDPLHVSRTMQEFFTQYESQIREIVLVPDGDVCIKPNVARGFGTFYSVLVDMGYEVRMVQLPHGRGKDDKIDDLIVGDWQGQDIIENINNCPGVRSYRESQASLIAQYPLITKEGRDNETIKLIDHNVNCLIKNHPHFQPLRYNLDIGQLEYEGVILEEAEIVNLLSETQYRLSIDVKQNMFGVNLTSVAMRERRYSPWQDYLNMLEWDGTERLKTWMVDYCNSKPTDMCLEGGLKWMVAAAGRILTPGCKVDYILVTTGPQGIGKSSLPVILFGDTGVRDISMGIPISERPAIMHSGQCCNWEELSAMGTYQLNHLKHEITATHDAFRRKYAKDPENRARDFVMYGSTNDTEFLPVDPTGHRRYVVIEMGQVEFKRLEADKDQLWAEAVYLFKQGIKFSEVEAAKRQGTAFVKHSSDYFEMLDTVRSHYAGVTGDGPKYAGAHVPVGEVRVLDGVEYFCATLKMWREGGDLYSPKGRAGESLNDHLRSNGWVCKAQVRLKVGKKSSVWFCPTTLLIDED